MLELLAPAKNIECAFAAIDCGADAIYIGAQDFGARKNVPNSIEDIIKIVEYAHKFNVKVYITMNTILNDKEIHQAIDLIKDLYKIGVDAFIIQDFGLIDVLLELGIPIHASTQCDNRSVEKTKFLQDVGFSRVILARELSLNQIREIKHSTDVELECFIHGALCVSYSGQCYLSYAIGGRSANRGECAQPCRKQYSLINQDGKILAKDKYLLCLKDFNASNSIKELAEAGVTSFKIEGRLKDINYIKNVVSYYRNILDNLFINENKNIFYKRTSSGKSYINFSPDVEKTFNRGFSEYFLRGRKNDIFNFNSSKSRGKFLGEVTKVASNYFEIKTNQKISPQDGLCFTSNGKTFGCLVNKIVENQIYPNKMDEIKLGLKIFRNMDVEFEKTIQNSKITRKIFTDIKFDKNIIQARDEDGNSVKISYNFNEFAKNNQKMKENILTQFKKSGDSIFEVQNIEIYCGELPFMKISELNELRRKILSELEKERLQNYKKNSASNKTIKSNFPISKMDYKANVLNKYAKEFYEKHNCKISEYALEKGLPAQGKVVMTTKHCIKHALGICKSSQSLFLVDEKGKKYKLRFNCEKCEMEIIF